MLGGSDRIMLDSARRTGCCAKPSKLGRVPVTGEFVKETGRSAHEEHLRTVQACRAESLFGSQPHLQDDEGDAIVIPGVNAYNAARYAEALGLVHEGRITSRL